MREKGFVLPLVLILIFIGAVGTIGVVQFLRSKASPLPPLSNKPCRLTVEDRFFPSAILEYKFQEKATNEGSLGVSYSNGQEATDSLKISDEIWVRLVKEDNLFPSTDLSEENIKNQTAYKKALRNEMSGEEFKEFEKTWKEKTLIVRRESIVGIPVVVFDWQTNVEGTPFFIQYTERETKTAFFMGFGKKVGNYQTYFENWHRQVCG